MAEQSINTDQSAGVPTATFTNAPRVSGDIGAASSRRDRLMRRGIDQGKQVLSKAQAHAQANPWMDVGIVAATGFALGYFLGYQSGSSYSRYASDIAEEEEEEA